MKEHPTTSALLLAVFTVLTNWHWSRTIDREFGQMSSTTVVSIDGPTITAFAYAILSIFLARSVYRIMRKSLDHGVQVPLSKRIFRFGDLWPALFALPVLIQVRFTVTTTDANEEMISHYARGYRSDASPFVLIMTVFCVFLIHLRSGWSRCVAPTPAEPVGAGNEDYHGTS